MGDCTRLKKEEATCQGILFRGKSQASRLSAIAAIALAIAPKSALYISDLVKRVGKALRQYPDTGLVRKATDEMGNVVWGVVRHVADS